MKKITIYAEHLNFGGIEKYIYLLTEMFKKDYSIEIISKYKYSEVPAFDFNKKIIIKYLSNDYYDKYSLKDFLKKMKLFSFVKEILRRKKLLNNVNKRFVDSIINLKTDYIITTRPSHNYLIGKNYNGNAIKIATEHNYHNNNVEYINNFVNSVKNFDYVIHCTKELYDFYKKKIIGPKNLYISNAIKLTNHGVSNLKDKSIISVGRLSPEKGYDDLILVMKNVCEYDNSIKLIICGDGYERKEIEALINKYNLNNNIQITGFIKKEELSQRYQEASLYILPSKSEAFGLVLLEAMEFGLPCIAFDDASGARNLLNNDVGILIKNRDHSEMAKNIITLLNSREKLIFYQQKSLKKVKEYDIEIIKKEWYSQILGRNNEKS